MKYVSFIVFLLCVALSQERKLEKQNTGFSADSQKKSERRDYEHLSGSMEVEGEDTKAVYIDSEEENSLEDENENNGFQEGLYNLLLRIVSKGSISEPVGVVSMGVKYVNTTSETKDYISKPVEVDSMGVKYVNTTSETIDYISEPVEVDSMGVKYVNTKSEMLKTHGGRKLSLNNGPKFTKDNIPALLNLYKSLDPVVKVEPSQNLGVAAGRLETAALENNSTENSAIEENEPGTVELSGITNSLSESSLLLEATTEATEGVGTANSTLMGDKPQARFGCFVSNLCGTFCQQYAILPDNTHVCCLLCSIHPTLIPNNAGGFICSCDYLG